MIIELNALALIYSCTIKQVHLLVLNKIKDLATSCSQNNIQLESTRINVKVSAYILAFLLSCSQN